MELRVLRYFLEVAREGNITHAAQRLHISQPTLSKQLKELEGELGKKLFIRGNYNVRLTDEGMLLRKRAEDILDMVGKTEEEFKALGEIIGDTLFIHIEKADRDYEGCYQMLVAQFAQQFAGEGVAFINREDDTGDPGLRTSKLSYHPVALLEKYTVTVDKPCDYCAQS